MNKPGVPEFTHIEIRAVRNPKWLEYYEKRGSFLSEEFPLGEFKLPDGYEDMEEKDIDMLRASLLTLVVLDRIPDIDKFLALLSSKQSSEVTKQ